MAKPSALARVVQFLEGVGIKAPWKVRAGSGAQAGAGGRARRRPARLSHRECVTPWPGARAPAQYTGPVSTPEYLSHIHKAKDFRKFGPA